MRPLLKSLLGIIALQYYCVAALAQQDCFDAIRVCSPSYTQANAYAGTGALSEIPTGSSCLGNGESNSVWYVFTIIGGGQLTFQLTPNVPTDDYDFAIYNLSVDSCVGIANGTNLPVSCNYSAETGATGLSAGATQSNAGSSDPNQNEPLTVSAGQTYALMVSNFTSSQSGYQLDFGGSASIVDQNPPSVASIDLGGQCSPTQVFLELNEPIACSSVQFNGGDFQITGAQGVTVQSATTIGCNAEGFATTIRLTFAGPIGTAGSYTISATNGVGGSTVEDFCGNEMPPGPIASFDVVEPGPVISIDNLVNTQCGQANGGVTISISAGMPPYNISWSTGSNQNQTTHNNLGPGTYFITVGDQNGCTANQSFQIINSDPLNISAQNVTGVTCNSSSDGSASVSVSNGSGNYSISWNTNPIQTGNSASNLPGGNVLVTVTDNSSGCTISQNIGIPQPPSVSVPISSVQPGCGASDGSATANPTGGNGGFSYSWNTNPVQTTATATGLTAGVYQVTVTDSEGCTGSSTIVLADNNPPQAGIVSTTPDCNQGTGSATAQATTGATPHTYSWSTNPVQTGPTATGLTEGDYYVTITDADGCVQIINVKIDTIAPPNILAVVTQPTCGMSDGEIETMVTGGTPPYVYSWSSSANSTSTESGLAEGNYTVTVTDEIGCTATETFTVLQIPPTSDFASNDVCHGDEMSFSSTTTSGATVWSWDFGDGNSSDQEFPTHTYSSSGQYEVTLILEGGCMNDTIVQTVIVFEPPTAAFHLEPEIITTRTTAQFVYDGNGATSFVWNFGDGESSTEPSPSHTYGMNGFQTAELWVQDQNGCADTTSLTFEVLLQPVIYLPNAFVPNGTPDNSRFKGYGIGVTDAELVVFDRWGTILFSSDNLNDVMNSGWDGTFKGKPVRQGVYAYKIKSDFYNNTSFEKIGTVTLIR